jgi:hypothetical protein
MAFKAVIRTMPSSEFRLDLLHSYPHDIYEAPLQLLHGGVLTSVVHD